MTRDSVLFPLPGSPSSIVIRPMGILLVHNQSTFSALIWSIVMINGSCFFGSLALPGSAPLQVVTSLTGRLSVISRCTALAFT
jgi:hypothetical protein